MELTKVLTPWNWFKKEEQQTLRPQQYESGQTTNHPLNHLHYDIDQIFENFFRSFPASPFPGRAERGMGNFLVPNLDIAEDNKGYSITLEVPGIEEKDIELTVMENTLTVRGEKQTENEHSEKQYHRLERSYGVFQRVLSLPNDADEENIQAKFKHGVLTITIGKNPKAVRSGRRIAIT